MYSLIVLCTVVWRPAAGVISTQVSWEKASELYQFHEVQTRCLKRQKKLVTLQTYHCTSLSAQSLYFNSIDHSCTYHSVFASVWKDAHLLFTALRNGSAVTCTCTYAHDFLQYSALCTSRYHSATLCFVYSCTCTSQHMYYTQLA